MLNIMGTTSVDYEKCKGDGHCVDVCPVGVYALKDGVAVIVNGDECVACNSCVEACDREAITVIQS